MPKYLFNEQITWEIEAENVDKAWELVNSPFKSNLDQVEQHEDDIMLVEIDGQTPVIYPTNDPNHSMNLPK